MSNVYENGYSFARHNAVSLYTEISPAGISVTVEMASDFPPNAWFSVEIAFDTDLDDSTGQSSPTYAFNGIGADFDVGVEVKDGLILSKWIEIFTSNGWMKIGEPSIELGSNYVKITFLRSDMLASGIDVQKSIRFVTFVISGLVTDMIPDSGEKPPELWISFPPQARIEAPSQVAEGTEIVLNGSTSIPTDAPIILYEWDLNGDGLPDFSSEIPWVVAVYSDDAVLDVTLWVMDALGLRDNITHLINVFNVPPSNLSVSTNGSLIVGDEVTFNGQAFDPGNDNLTFTWDFGDGTFAEGQIVTHTYQNKGSYVVTLNVADDDGGISTMKVTVKISTSSQPTPTPYIPHISISKITPSKEDPKEGEEISFTITVLCESNESLTGILKLFVDDPTGTKTPFWQSSVELRPGSNDFTSPAWISESGEHDVTVFLEIEEGTGPVNESIKILISALYTLMPLFGVFGFIIFIIIILILKKVQDNRTFCEKHPEVVEDENKKCWSAQFDLDNGIDEIQEEYEEKKSMWDGYIRQIVLLLIEWDSTVGLIYYWLREEKEIYEEVEKVQQIVGIVTSAKDKAVKAVKEDGEAALKELGEDIAKDLASEVLSEVSDTISALLDLEDWAIREIGVGIAKLLIGIEPIRNVIILRKKAESISRELQSWVSHRAAWNSGRRPPDTLQSCIKDAKRMLNAIDGLIEDFENAVAGFRCVKCEIPGHILDKIQNLRSSLESYIKTFEDLMDQIEKRLKQGIALFRRKDVYPKPGYEWLGKSKRTTNEIKRVLEESIEGRKS